jgi:hypothetical protein
MMDHMMGGGMVWGMGLIGTLLIIVLVLAAAALVFPRFLQAGAGQFAGAGDAQRLRVWLSRHRQRLRPGHDL